MCSIAFRHASGEVPLNHEKNTLIMHLFSDTDRSWGKCEEGLFTTGERLAIVHHGGTSRLKSESRQL